MATVVLGSKRAILGGSAVQRKRKHGKSHQRNRSTTNEEELVAGTRTVDEDELALPISKTKEEFQSTIALITNNKLNDTNSWEVPIVEYFHDMNILRGEDGSIDFQTASTTLDGCTKIMSKRVDLIATDADSLLSLMKVKKKKNTIEEEEDTNDPDYGPKKRVVKKTDVFESFNKLRVTDQQTERVNIDPVFRKMVAEFDEGGTKSLLMNTLRISSEGQVMLDDAIPTGSEDIVNPYGDEDAEVGGGGLVDDKSMIKTNSDDDGEMELDRDGDGDVKMHYTGKTEEDTGGHVDALINNFRLLIRPEEVNGTSLIPSLDKLRAFMESEEFGDGTRSVFDIVEENQSRKGFDTSEMEVPDYHVEYDYDVENFDLGGDEDQGTNISEDTRLGGYVDDAGDGGVDMETVTRRLQREVEIMEALDRKMQKRLDRSHWKIRAINSRPQLFNFDTDENDERKTAAKVTGKGKVKNAYVIDFLHDTAAEKDLFEKSKNDETRRDKAVVRVDETTLPDLKAWQADRLTECFIQPKRTLHMYAQGDSHTLDRSYWAERYNDRNDTLAYTVPGHEADGLDGSFGGDVDYGEMDMDADADMDAGVYEFDAGASGASGANSAGGAGGAGGMEHVEVVKGGRVRSKDTLHYERRVKRINVRALKRNLWEVTREHADSGTVKLSEVVRDTYTRYEGREREDLSTSFFFICMLHIANEEGLRVESVEGMKDLVIKPV